MSELTWLFWERILAISQLRDEYCWVHNPSDTHPNYGGWYCTHPVHNQDECDLCESACDEDTLRKNVVLVDNQYGRMRSVGVCDRCNSTLKAISTDWAYVFSPAELAMVSRVVD